MMETTEERLAMLPKIFAELERLIRKFPDDEISKFLCSAVNDSWYADERELLKGLQDYDS